MTPPKKRADGEGSLYRDGDNWVAAVSYRDPASGQRRQRRIRKPTKNEAAAELKNMIGRADTGAPLRDAAVTVESWSRHWESSALPASDRRVTTQGTYRTLLKSLVRPYLGGVALSKLRASDIDRWLLALADRGLSVSTRRQALTVLRAVLSDAIRDGLLATNPAAAVSRPKLERTEAKHFSAVEIAQLLAAAAEHRHRHLLVVLAGTGLRRGECLALSWRNVDFAAGEIRVRGTLVRTDAGLVIHPPKTDNGWRKVPISAAVERALTEQRQQQRHDRLKAGPSWIGGGDLVFTSEAGTALDPRNFTRWFAVLATAAGVDGSVHTLRHSAVTSMLDAGVPLVVASRLAGHSSISITGDIYGHVGEESAKAAMTAAADGLGLA